MIFLGFDTDQYPGDDMMVRLRTRFAFTGFYLAPAPSHGDAGWMGKLSFLKDQHYGFLPTYVGQELVGPGRHNVTAGQGAIDGADAANLALKAGFGMGSYVYLDLENGPPFTSAEGGYVKAFRNALGAGGYALGIYGSHLYAGILHELAPGARIWTVHTATTSPHPVNGPIIAPDPTCAYSQAVACQFDQSAELPEGIEVDLDSSAVADPSRP